MILRSSNYTLDNEGYYHMSSPDGVIRTKNALVTLDDDLNMVDYEYLRIPEERWGPVKFPLVRGLEDARIHWKDEAWHIYGTLREHRSDGLCEIAAGRIEGNQIVDRFIYDNPEPGRHQKNWMAMSGTDSFIYLVQPPGVVRSGFLDTDAMSPRQDPVAEGFRGSSQAIRLDDGWIAVTHEVDWSTGRRRYFHRFVQFDSLGYALSYTEPFFIVKPEIEFVAGIVEHKGNYVLSFGYRDLWAGLAHVPQKEVVAALSH